MKNFYKEYFHIAKGEKIRDKVILTRMISSVVVTLFCLVAISLTAYAYFYHNVSSGLNIMSSAHFEVEVSVSAQIPVVTESENNAGESTEESENSESAENSPESEAQAENILHADGEAESEPEAQTESNTQPLADGDEEEKTESESNSPTEEETGEGQTENLDENSEENTIPPEAYSPQVIKLNKKTHTVRLYPDVIYEITLTGIGDAKTGYCHIEADGCDDIYITEQIGKNGESYDDTLSFYITVSAQTTVRIISNWGTSSAYDAYINHNPSDFYVLEGNTVSILLPVPEETLSETPEINEGAVENSDGEIIHTVSDGEFLFAIAERYGVSVERIVAYNEISDPSIIHTGDIIKIPPEDWVIPQIPSVETESDPNTPTEDVPVVSPDEDSATAENPETETETETETEESEEIPSAEPDSESDAEAEAPDESSDTEPEAAGDTDSEITQGSEAPKGEAETEQETEKPEDNTALESEAETDTETKAFDESESKSEI